MKKIIVSTPYDGLLDFSLPVYARLIERENVEVIHVNRHIKNLASELDNHSFVDRLSKSSEPGDVIFCASRHDFGHKLQGRITVCHDHAVAPGGKNMERDEESRPMYEIVSSAYTGSLYESFFGPPKEEYKYLGYLQTDLLRGSTTEEKKMLYFANYDRSMRGEGWPEFFAKRRDCNVLFHPIATHMDYELASVYAHYGPQKVRRTDEFYALVKSSTSLVTDVSSLSMLYTVFPERPQYHINTWDWGLRLNEKSKWFYQFRGEVGHSASNFADFPNGPRESESAKVVARKQWRDRFFGQTLDGEVINRICTFLEELAA